MTDYFLPPDYVCNPPLREQDGPYWTPQRIKSSRYFQYHVYQWARRLADQKPLRRVADIGCGPGTKLMEMFGEQFDIHGFDQPEAIEICRTRYERGTFEVIDLDRECPEKNEEGVFDLVICADVIEHLEYPERLLRHIQRMSDRHTQIILSTPDRVRLNGAEARSPTNKAHVREWTYDEFRCFLEHTGFVIESAETLPLMKRVFSIQAIRHGFHSLLNPVGLNANLMVHCTIS